MKHVEPWVDIYADFDTAASSSMMMMMHIDHQPLLEWATEKARSVIMRRVHLQSLFFGPIERQSLASERRTACCRHDGVVVVVLLARRDDRDLVRVAWSQNSHQDRRPAHGSQSDNSQYSPWQLRPLPILGLRGSGGAAIQRCGSFVDTPSSLKESLKVMAPLATTFCMSFKSSAASVTFTRPRKGGRGAWGGAEATASLLGWVGGTGRST